ncbi:FtsX-like permease family protein [Chitinophaga lutea]|uniref:FtsX-like permease family protein n=1 Tax=Chitinophaga lutea TaxID=2488634 RepID=A0A3N4PT64_9BACT|nr:ABC transporter permease [Chitinophaga lutea]RPE09969.1 FtsX-like permease family protein [Chitinophaga lutea]
MLKNYFKVIWRSLKKDRQSSFLNLIGLSTGLACALFIYLWVMDELRVDKFNTKDSQIFKVMEHRIKADGIWTAPSTSGPMAEAMKADMPEVVYAITEGSAADVTLTVQQQDVKASGKYTGKDFFNIFSYQLLQGTPDQVLAGSNSIVLSDVLALKLFNTTENLIGKTVEFGHKDQYTVSGVYKSPPPNATEQFDFLLPISILFETRENIRSWGNTGPRTVVLLKEGTDVAQFNKKLAGFVTLKTNGETKHRTPFLKPYAENYLYGTYENGVNTGGRISYVKLFGIIAIFILIIAAINFMNLSTAKAARRMKEIGIKKVAGASRGSLMLQYMGESVLMTFIALIAAVVLVALLLPAFNDITGKQLVLSLDPAMILSFLLITLFTGLIAGSYPALYLSGFKPITVLKGRLVSSAGELWIRKGLVVFQFTISAVLIVSVMVVYRQVEYVQNKNLGYDRDNILSFRREGKLQASQDHLESFIREVKALPGVKNASYIAHNMAGHNSGTSGVEWTGKNPEDRTEFENVAVSYDMLETMDFKLKEGRTFSRNFASDSNAIIFNEAGIKFMGMKDPLGKQVKLWGETREIIGVVKDFHFESLHEDVKPLFFRLNPGATYSVAIKIMPGKEQETIAGLETLYRQFNPGFPLAYKFLDEDYQQMYTAEKRIGVLSRYFAGLAILISCLGLFGLAAYTAQRRQKEIGVRKVVGATTGNVVVMLSRDFLKLVLIAILIAFPLAWWASHQWLQGFAYHITPNAGMFVIAGFATLVITCLTISYQAIKAAMANPAISLKAE